MFNTKSTETSNHGLLTVCLFSQTAIKSWGDNKIRVSLDWALPETSGKVRWSFWTSAEDRVAKTFKENFQLAFQRLGASHQVFTPHFLLSDGTHYCFRTVSGKQINICGKHFVLSIVSRLKLLSAMHPPLRHCSAMHPPRCR